jgi:hypothetical protein
MVFSIIVLLNCAVSCRMRWELGEVGENLEWDDLGVRSIQAFARKG